MLLHLVKLLELRIEPLEKEEEEREKEEENGRGGGEEDEEEGGKKRVGEIGRDMGRRGGGEQERERRTAEEGGRALNVNTLKCDSISHLKLVLEQLFALFAELETHNRARHNYSGSAFHGRSKRSGWSGFGWTSFHGLL